MKNRYYVSNDALPGPTYVGGAYLITPFKIGTAILTPDQAKTLKDQGYTVHLKDENVEYGTGPENENDGGGNSGASSIDVDFVGDPDNNNVFYFELKGLPYYINIHTVAPDPGNPDDETVLYIELGDGAHGERHTLQFTSDTESQEKPTLSSNNLYDSTGTIRFNDIDCSWNWIEIEYDARGNNWKVVNWANNMKNLPQRPLYGIAQGKYVLYGNNSYQAGFGAGLYHPNARIELRIDNENGIVEEVQEPAQGYYRIPDTGIMGQRLAIVINGMTNNGQDSIVIYCQGSNGITDTQGAPISDLTIHYDNCGVLMEWNDAAYCWKLIDTSGGEGTVTYSTPG